MDTLSLSQFTGWTENYAASTGSTLDTGDLRRRYNFGSMVTELNISSDPFFRVASVLRKESTDDPQFKFAEQRPSFHKRYAYVAAHSADGVTYTTDSSTVTATNIEVGDTWYVKMETDYKSAGNLTNIYDATSAARSQNFVIGASGTRPQFFMVGQLVKIPFGSDYQTPNDFIVGRVEEATNSTSEDVILKLKIIRTLGTSTNNYLQWASASAPMTTCYNVALANIEAGLESKRSYVVGSAYAKGSGYPETWYDQPYSTGYGQTQIFKTALGMDNTTRATVLKYAGNEWARIWGSKLLEHKWDIEHTLVFGRQYTDVDGIQYTQGLVDYVVQYGNLFSLTHSTKTHDDFLDDLSQFLDPRYNNANATMFMTDTYTYNWMNKLAGYFNNNIQISPNFRADFAFKGFSNKLGLDFATISTIYGDMNIVRNIHLDGTGIHILAVNMNYVKVRPLVGNGINRDTSVYVGVQTLENSGVDKRVDLILTELGLQIEIPEAHAIWK